VAGTELAWGVVFAVLVAATFFDLRSRRVPAWLTGGGIAAGVLLAAWEGPPALMASLGGALVGGLIFLPFVWRGWLGGADALLLAAVGAWQGWRVALWTAWWTALAGAVLALGVWGWRAWRLRRISGRGGDAFGERAEVRADVPGGEQLALGAPAVAERSAGAVLAAARGEPFPYVPAILAGTLLALALGS
jgi:Flp pilus assembly protein protease CpaA